MIAYLFSLLLVPLFPGLDSPDRVHGGALAAIEQQLALGEVQPGATVQDSLAASNADNMSLGSPNLPSITGRIFEWSSSQSMAEAMQRAAIGQSASALRFTGLIESYGQKAAILSDGPNQYVVGVGSYVLKNFKVISLDKHQIVLEPIHEHAGRQALVLSLMQESAARGS